MDQIDQVAPAGFRDKFLSARHNHPRKVRDGEVQESAGQLCP